MYPQPHPYGTAPRARSGPRTRTVVLVVLAVFLVVVVAGGYLCAGFVLAASHHAQTRDALEVARRDTQSTPIECYAVIADWDAAAGEVTIWSNFHGPFVMQPLVAAWACRTTASA